MTPAGALCTACGACCNGTLFDEVPLAAEEVELGVRLRLPIVPSGEEAAMALPCPRLEVATCTVYPDRPSTCRTYKCGLLEELERGSVSSEEAHAHVGALREAAQHARALLPESGSTPLMRAYERFAEHEGGRRSASFEANHAELIARMREVGVRVRAVTRGVAERVI